jgi:hypothetical protein
MNTPLYNNVNHVCFIMNYKLFTIEDTGYYYTKHCEFNTFLMCLILELKLVKLSVLQGSKQHWTDNIQYERGKLSVLDDIFSRSDKVYSKIRTTMSVNGDVSPNNILSSFFYINKNKRTSFILEIVNLLEDLLPLPAGIL